MFAKLAHPLVARTLGWSFIAAALTSAVVAAADEEFDIATSPGKVVLTTKGHWHVNPEYPWSLVEGGEKIGKAHFVLKEGTAEVDAPKGKATLKGGVCNGEQCRSFHKDVVIP